MTTQSTRRPSAARRASVKPTFGAGALAGERAGRAGRLRNASATLTQSTATAAEEVKSAGGEQRETRITIAGMDSTTK